MGIAKQAAMLRAARNSASIRSYHPAGTVKCDGVRLFRSQAARDVACILDVNLRSPHGDACRPRSALTGSPMFPIFRSSTRTVAPVIWTPPIVLSRWMSQSSRRKPGVSALTIKCSIVRKSTMDSGCATRVTCCVMPPMKHLSGTGSACWRRSTNTAPCRSRNVSRHSGNEARPGCRISHSPWLRRSRSRRGTARPRDGRQTDIAVTPSPLPPLCLWRSSQCPTDLPTGRNPRHI